ncbi:MAG: pyruvate kinase [Candidatus Gastranaerophilales bacterium]|nr:pyruvate kinase [Candidatus Gastranaerophilales bacterium]
MNLSELVKTKIVATLGPASCDYETIKELMKSGISMFRLNSSHGTEEIHSEYLANIRKASLELKEKTPILLDLQGPKIRVGNIAESVNIKVGQEIILTPIEPLENEIPVDYKGIAQDVKAGDKILLDDGKIGLKVLEIIYNKVKKEVLYGEEIKPRKGINVPTSASSLSAVTERDIKYIEFAVKNNLDYVALSFVRNEEDIKLAKKYITDFGGDIPVIAKIEKPQAIDNIDKIIDISDGIMVARGDLGIELSPEQVPVVQKLIVKKAEEARKVCIVATQMLETMIEQPIPTRAEASDVANAIIDGTDAVMLSAETASGKYPILAVQTMSKIAKTVEDNIICPDSIMLEINEEYNISSQSIAMASVQMAKKLKARAILAFSHTGYTPKLISKLKPCVPVFMITNEEKYAKQMNLYWNIYADCVDIDLPLDDALISRIDNYVLNNTDIKLGDRIIIVGSIPKLITGKTNSIYVHIIGEPYSR